MGLPDKAIALTRYTHARSQFSYALWDSTVLVKRLCTLNPLITTLEFSYRLLLSPWGDAVTSFVVLVARRGCLLRTIGRFHDNGSRILSPSLFLCSGEALVCISAYNVATECLLQLFLL